MGMWSLSHSALGQDPALVGSAATPQAPLFAQPLTFQASSVASFSPQEGPLILYFPRGATWLTPVCPGPSQLLMRVMCARFLCHFSTNWSWLLRGCDCALTIVPLLLRPVPFSLPHGHFFQLWTGPQGLSWVCNRPSLFQRQGAGPLCWLEKKSQVECPC